MGKRLWLPQHRGLMNCGCHGIMGSEIRLSWRLGVVVAWRLHWGGGTTRGLTRSTVSLVNNAVVAVASYVMGLGCREPGCGDPSVEGSCHGIVAGRLWLPRSVVKGMGWPLCCG